MNPSGMPKEALNALVRQDVHACPQPDKRGRGAAWGPEEYCGLVWQQVLISSGKQVPRREFSGITGSPSHPRGDIPEWQNFPAAVWNVFPQGEGG